MKKIFITLLIVLCTNFLFATEQLQDNLIIGNDTFCLKSFPLEKLNFKQKPFSYGEYSFQSTGCWRGYQATWEIVEGSLYLVEIIKIDSTKERLNLEEYFTKNGYTPKWKNGKILADWYSVTLESYFADHHEDCVHERIELNSKRSKKLEFVKGEVVFNKLKY